MEILLASGRFHPTQLDQDPESVTHDHPTLFSKATFVSDEPMQLETLEETLKRLPVEIYRCKGIVFAPSEQGHRAIVQVVGKRAEITYEGEWTNGKQKTRLVAIGTHGKVSDELMEKLFSPCIVSYRSDERYTTSGKMT